MPIKRLILLSATLATCGAVILVIARYFEHRNASATLTLSERQTQQALNLELQDPKFRAMYAVHKHFLGLFESMPTFEQANFGPNTRTEQWRSMKWAILSVYQAPDGTQFAKLGYAQGPGTDQVYTARLVNGQYIGRLDLDWNAVFKDQRQSVAFANELPFVCRDVRLGTTQYAAVPSVSDGPRITKAELRAASLGDSDLSGVVLACYHFARMNIVELFAGTGVLFRVDGPRLIPLVRGYIAYADPAGHFMIIQVDGGYDDNTDWPVRNYLEVFNAKPSVYMRH